MSQNIDEIVGWNSEKENSEEGGTYRYGMNTSVEKYF